MPKFNSNTVILQIQVRCEKLSFSASRPNGYIYEIIPALTYTHYLQTLRQQTAHVIK